MCTRDASHPTRFRRFGPRSHSLPLPRRPRLAVQLQAIALLKDCGYKLDLHLMPNLPGASAELDARMFHEVLTDEWLQADQWKIYPCEITPWTKIKEWFEVGAYVPYPDEQLVDLLLRVLPKIHPWVRVNRVVRDIPSQ